MQKKKTNLKFHLRSAIIRFVVFGLLGYAVEIVASGFLGLATDLVTGKFTNQSLEMMGHTGFWTFFVYGIASLPYTFLFTKLRNEIPNKIAGVPFLGLFIRTSFYTMIFFAIEFITSGFAKYLLGINIYYDYSGHPLSILGLVDIGMFPMWLVMAWFGEIITIRLMQFEDIFAGPSIHKEINVLGEIRKYLAKIGLVK